MVGLVICGHCWGQGLGVGSVIMSGPSGSLWNSPSTWSNFAAPSSSNHYFVLPGKTLAVPSGPSNYFAGGGLTIGPDAALRVNVGPGTTLGMANGEPFRFNQSTMEFRFPGTNSPVVVIDAPLGLEGANQIQMIATQAAEYQFNQPVTGFDAALTVKEMVPSSFGQLVHFEEVDLRSLTLGSEPSLGLSSVASFQSLNLRDMEVRGGWTAEVRDGGHLYAFNVKLTDATSSLVINGEIVGFETMDLGGGSLIFGESAVTEPVIGDLSGASGSVVTNLGGSRSLTIQQYGETEYGGRFVDVNGDGDFSVRLDGDGWLSLTGESILPGTLEVLNGRLTFGSEGSGGGIDWGRLELESVLEIAGVGSRDYSGEVSGGGRIVHSSVGTTRLRGDGTSFHGAVEVTGGLLQLDGAMGSAGIEVHGGILGGTGVLGDVVVGVGGEVGPGNSIGTLTMSSLALSGSHVVEWSATTPMVDLLRVTGLLQLNDATLRFEPLEGVGVLSGEEHVIVEYGSLEGVFGQVENLPSGYRLAYGEGGGRISLIAIPEPGLLFLVGMGGVCFFSGRRRRA